MKKLIALLLAAVMCLTLCACASLLQTGPTEEELAEQQRLAEEEQKRLEEEQKAAEEEAARIAAEEERRKQFSVLLESSYYCEESADKAAAVYLAPAETYGTIDERFIPEDLKAETPEDVRFLVRVSYRREVDGTYIVLGSSGSHTAWQRFYDVQIIDLRDRAVINETTFVGSEPPYNYNAENQGHGDYPSDESVSEWISTAIEEGLVMLAEQDALRAYHDSMAALSDSNYRCDPNATQAVAWIEEKADGEWVGTYCQTYIPEALLTEVPEEVRYIVKVRHVKEAVGIYYGITSHTAYEFCYEAVIIDLTNGSTVAEKDFEGGPAPEQYFDWNKGTGSAPSAESISNWIAESIGVAG